MDKPTIQQQFELFHALNPEIYQKFKELALEAIAKGRKKISFKLLINRIRWDYFILTEEPSIFNIEGKRVRFKINNNYESRYSRLFISEYPQYRNLIELRTLKTN